MKSSGSTTPSLPEPYGSVGYSSLYGWWQGTVEQDGIGPSSLDPPTECAIVTLQHVQ
jgi:hypothetical protein